MQIAFLQLKAGETRLTGGVGVAQPVHCSGGHVSMPGGCQRCRRSPDKVRSKCVEKCGGAEGTRGRGVGG